MAGAVAAAAAASVEALDRRLAALDRRLPTFSVPETEAAYTRNRLALLARVDSHLGCMLALPSAAWAVRLAGLAWRQHGQLMRLVREAGPAALSALLHAVPPLFVALWGAAPYSRHRCRVLLAQRLVMLPLLAVVPQLPLAMGLAEALPGLLGQLLLATRAVPLLLLPLGFQLPPGRSAALQTVAVAIALRHQSQACSTPFFQLPSSQDALTRLAHLLSRVPSPMPLPPVALPDPYPHTCWLLGAWIQLCWLLVLPCALVAAWDLQARQHFALNSPAGPNMPAAERAWWAALALPGAWHQVLLLVPAFSLAAWRLMALAAGG